MIKKVYIVMMMLIIMLSIMFNGCIPTERKYAKGTYIGDSEGYYSSLIVEVEVDDYNILSIKILEDEEPPILADIVFEKLPPIIIKNNGTDVDVISGATYTSKALLDAVNKAIDESRRLLDETSD